jgi:hypothetical protein
MQWWMAPALALANAWGPLDAVLRYPVVHDMDSIFAMKQLMLLCGKLALFPFGFADLLGSLRTLALLWSLDFVVLPLMYLVALPLERSATEQRRLASGVNDVDLVFRLARAVASPPNRHACLAMFEQRAKAVLSPRRKATQLPLWRRCHSH